MTNAKGATRRGVGPSGSAVLVAAAVNALLDGHTGAAPVSSTGSGLTASQRARLAAATSEMTAAGCNLGRTNRPQIAIYLSPNQSVAIPRNERNPTTSVMVVTNTPDETAGSARKCWSTSGTRMPPSAPATRLQ